MLESNYGRAYCGETGVSILMEDLGAAMAQADKDTCMLGGGNPAHIPEVETILLGVLS
jgi:valine--pyruvate aminotransferase